MITILSVVPDYDDNEIIIKNDSGDILKVYRYESNEEFLLSFSSLSEIVRMNNSLRERWDEIVENVYR